MAIVLGTRVVRGPNWKWDDQDHGEGHVGTVIYIGKGDLSDRPEKTVIVMWDMGRKNNYRTGFNRCFDLRIFDNAQTGVVHPDVSCIVCGQDGIRGIRWKCLNCFNCNLCSPCFMDGRHEISHQFQRFITSDSAGPALFCRQGARKVEALGTFPGATVQRGNDWRYGDQDGGDRSRPGKMFVVDGWGDTFNRAAAGVKWPNHSKLFRYRLGIEGKVDIKCVKEAQGGTYYPDLLPNLGESQELHVGDTVVIQLGKDTLKSLDAARISLTRETEEVAGEKGVMKGVTHQGEVSVQFMSGQTVQVNPIAVLKVSAFSVGDQVRIIKDQSQAESLQKGHGGWNHSMRKILGREAKVEKVYSDGDAKVVIPVNDVSVRLLFHPACLTLVESVQHEAMFEQEPEDAASSLSVPPEILARGPRAQQAYTEAARVGTKKVFRTRLMLVGQERVGKTSLKKSLTGQGFDEDEAITDGVETSNACEISVEVAKTGGIMWFIHREEHENLDSKGDEYNKALAEEIAKKLIITAKDRKGIEPQPSSKQTDTRKEETLKADDKIPKQSAASQAENSQKEQASPESLASAKPDPDGINRAEQTGAARKVEAPKVDEMPTHLASLVENSLKEQVRTKESGTDGIDGGKDDGLSLSIWDFAGHDVYYTTHQVFLTWRAVYVIVFDLSRSLDSVLQPECQDKEFDKTKGGKNTGLTCLEFINFWLCSIFAHAVAPDSVTSKNTGKTTQKSPPIFIVGTHRESIKGNKREKKNKIDSAFDAIRKTIKKKPFECHVIPRYYAIENSLDDNDKELIALRKHIEKVAIEEPYMGEEIPLRWLKFEEALAADKTNFLSLDQTKELTKPVGIESENELLTMLTFYHDLGYIVYFGDMVEHKSRLRDIVILNPQWLIDVFKQVITILDPAEREGIVSDAWSILEEDGILEDRLIQHMWKGFLEQKKALVELMAKFDLVCEVPVQRLKLKHEDENGAQVSYVPEEDTKRYYVPSRLMSPFPDKEMIDIKSSTDFYVDFKGFLPDGLFHRLMTRTVVWMGEQKYGQPVSLFHRHISLVADKEHRAVLKMLSHNEAAIKVTVFRPDVSEYDGDYARSGQGTPDPNAVKEVMGFVSRMLESLRLHWAKRIEYDLCFPCQKCGEKKLFKECSNESIESLQCGLHAIPITWIKSKYGLVTGVESCTKSPMQDSRLVTKESNILCDSYLSDLAEEIGSEWQRLGIRLGLKQAAIDHIEEEKLKPVDRRLAMLQLWRQRSSSGVDRWKMIEDLCKAMNRCSRTDLEEKIREDAGI